MLKATSKLKSADVLLSVISPIRVLGNVKMVLTGAASLAEAGPEHISFCNLHGRKALRAIMASQAGMVICFDDIPDIDKLADFKCIVTTVNPRLAFIRCLNHHFKKEVHYGIHPSAVLEEDVKIAPTVRIGAGTYIGRGAKIGEGTIIENGAYVGPGTQIGRNCYLQMGAVIGCEGQGFERNDKGVLEKFPQTGRVVLEDNVEIGANTTVVRGTFRETRIGQGSKVGHLSNIGHNVTIGEHVFISASVVVGGSSRIGDFSWVAPGAIIRDSIRIGKRVKIGLGAIVTKNVKDEQTLLAIPARNYDQYFRLLRLMKKADRESSVPGKQS